MAAQQRVRPHCDRDSCFVIVHVALIHQETEAWPIRVPLEKFETEALQQFWNEPSQRQVEMSTSLDIHVRGS